MHGHDFAQPLANGSTGTLVFADTDPALFLSADILDQIAQTKAILFELSIVTRPAYPAAAVAIEQRSVSGPYAPTAF